MSFDSEIYTDDEYFNTLADLMPLSVIPADKKLIIIEENNFKFNSQGIGTYGAPDFEQQSMQGDNRYHKDSKSGFNFYPF